jgi:hypothetical protein
MLHQVKAIACQKRGALLLRQPHKKLWNSGSEMKLSIKEFLEEAPC